MSALLTRRWTFKRSWLAALALACAPLTVAQSVVSISSYQVAPSTGQAQGIAAGADGALWFTQPPSSANAAANNIGRLSLDGTFKTYALPQPAGPLAIAAGPDGALWFTENAIAGVGRISLSGAVTEYPTVGKPWGITQGPDGVMWFTNYQSAVVGRVMPTGQINGFTLAALDAAPLGIAKGSDGNVWFTESGRNAIARVTPGGTVNEYPLSTDNSVPFGIALGTDGALWFTEAGAKKVGRIGVDGVITEYDGLPGNPYAIAPGPDGAMWFVMYAGTDGRLGRIARNGTINTFAVPTARISDHSGITAGPDGAIWFTAPNYNGTSQIFRAAPLSIVTDNLSTAVSGTAYSEKLVAFGGTGVLTWTASTLPAGFALSTDGTLSGMPAAPGTFSFTVTVQDSAATPLLTSTTLTVTVKDTSNIPPSITTTLLADGVVTFPYSQTLSATGGTKPYQWLVGSGMLPPGLTLDSAAGRIAGTPVGAGTWSFSIVLTDANQFYVVKPYIIVVKEEPERVGIFSQVASGGGWKTSLYLINDLPRSVPVTVRFRSDAGSDVNFPLAVTQPGGTQTLQSSSWSGTIGAGSTILIETSAGDASLTGWAEVLGYTHLRGYGVFHYTPAKGAPSEATVPLETVQDMAVRLPYELDNGFGLGVAVNNVMCNLRSLVSVTAYDNSGHTSDHFPFELLPCAHKSYSPPDIDLASVGPRGMLEYRSVNGATLTGLGIRVNPSGGFTSTMPLTAVPLKDNHVGAFSHVAVGGGWKTMLYLSNPNAKDAKVTLIFHSDNGQATAMNATVTLVGGMALPKQTPFAVTIGANATALIECQTETPNATMTGWIEVQGDSSIMGYGVFHYSSPQGVESEGTVTMDAYAASNFILPYESENNFAMGVALINQSTQPTTVNVTTYDANGVKLGSTAIDMEANGHRSFMIADKVPAAANNRGYMVFAAPDGFPITGLGIRVNPAGGFTSAPKL